MNSQAGLARFKHIGTGLSFIVFPLVWAFAFAVHPNLLQPRPMLGPEELILRAHGNVLLQFAHVLVTLNAALLVVIALYFMRVLAATSAAWMGLAGAMLAILGACLLAADKGALCLAMSALDTLPQKEFEQAMPGMIAIFSFKGWMWLVLGLVFMPIGVLIQAAGMWRTGVLPRWQLGLLLASLVFIATPDGAEIINLAAALAMAAAMLPYGVKLMRNAGTGNAARA